ncbi:MAG: NAD(+)/NADH kinase [Salinibacterium sp.]|nr:NAD(+)/NADH kinase [Salinibacterium sp.]
MTLAPRIVLVHRRTEYAELLDRHATRGQAEFFLSSRGRSITEVKQRHDELEASLALVSRSLPEDTRQARVERSDLDRYAFAPEDIVVIVGQDGLVANVAKYLTGQPVIGIDPEPGRNAGVLVTHAASDAADLIAATIAARAVVHPRSMVRATLDDGQTLVALNELYFGDEGHQSSRYVVTVPGGDTERQSSSGVIVATGTGSTGWAASIATDRALESILPPADSEVLSWYIREAWPSRSTGRTLTSGLLASGDQLQFVVESDSLVTFGDGIEGDYLAVGWGQRLTVELSDRRLNLVQ